MALPFLALFLSAPPLLEDEAAQFAYECVRRSLQGQPMPVAFRDLPAQGVFVTVESGGQVIGCRGTLSPTQPDLATEIWTQAKNASLHDPRYGRVRLGGRPFSVTVTLVDRITPCRSVMDLKPQEGLILTSQGRTGVVLPWEGRDPKTRLNWAYQKAKAPPSSPVTLQVLVARRAKHPQAAPASPAIRV